MSATSTTGRAALVAANGRARRPAEPPQGDLSHAEAQRDRERRDFWFGEVPDGWEVRKIKFTFSERKQKGYPELPLLAATQNHGVILKNKYENRTVEAIKGLESLKLVEIGDFVISLRSFQGGLELAHDRGIISPAYTILMPTHITREYFKYYAKSPTFIALLRSTVTGIREGQNIDYNKLREYSIPIPPKETQLTIAAYLDAETGRVDKAIAAEEKMIALLQERREIVINEAVGSGEMRKGWKVKPWNGIFANLDYLRKPITADQRPRANPQYDYYGASGVIDKIDYYNVDDTVLLIAEDGANLVLRNLPLVYKAKGKVWINNHAHILKPRVDNYDFLSYLLESYDYTTLITGSAQPKLSQGQLATIRLAIPPIPEQEEIVKRLDAETGKIDRAIEVKRRQIELLRERRQIVIDEAVTGKVKVA